MSLKTKNNLYRTKSFWLSKKWLEEKPIFSFWSTLFSGHRNIRNEKNSFRLLLPTLPEFLKTTIYSAIIVLIFESFNKILPLKINIDTNAVDTLLTAIASIMGVFLGLYFTAISGIASNFLLRATQDVRRLFLSAPKGQQYVRTIALTGIITIFFIVIKALGHAINPFGLIFLSLLAAYVVIRFWDVGSDVFNSLEPTNSLPWVTRDIADSIKSVTPPGFQWTKPAIQNHHRALAAYNLELINNIVDFGIKEIKLSDNQLIVALKYLDILLFFYSDEKGKIPTDSYWYVRKNQYENWALANSTQIALALNTGTTIQPKIIKNFTWFEERTLDIGIKIFNFFAEEKRIAPIFEGFDIFVSAAEIYGKDFDVSAIKMLFQKLETATNFVYSIETNTDQARKEKLAFVDSQGRLAIAALLGLTKYLDKCSADDLIKTISKIEWTSNSKSIYLTGLPSAIISRLESTASDLKNEKIVEGQLVSPEWYIRTLCIQKYLFSLKEYFDYVKSLHSDYFQQKFEKLLTTDSLSLAVQLIQRWIEFSNKYCRLIELLKKHVEDCKQFHQVQDLPWAPFDFDSEEKICSDRRKEVTDKMIELLPKLKTTVSSNGDLPDYFGQALTMGVQACYEACEDNDHERLKKLFPIVFDASLTAHDITRQIVQDWSQDDSKIVYSTEPLINLFDLSGYVLLYSELYQNPELWNVAKNLWEIYLGAVNAKQVITFIGAIVGYRNTLFTIMPQATLRSGWEMIFNQKLREQGFSIFPETRTFLDRRRQPTHASPIIRAIGRSSGLMGLNPGQDIFFTEYLSKRSEAEGIELSDRYSLGELIERERQGNNADDEDE